MKWLEKYKFQLISIGVITMIICFLFNKPLTGVYTFGGPDSLSPSAVHQGITLTEEENGKYPLWMPWVFSGLPSVHSFQNISDYYFPNSFINILKSIGMPGFWNYIFHFILAGMGVFTILRTLGTSWYNALFGGLSFALMPYLITMIVHGHGSQMMTTAWLPWVIWAILRLYDDVSLKNMGILGLIVGLQMQRAHVQIAYYTWMAAGLLIVMLLCRIHAKPRKNLKWVLYVCSAFMLGLCMAMWIYLPAMNYTPHSIRGAGSMGGTGFDYATAWSFSFSEMTTFFIPSFYGFGGATYWGNMPFTDYPNYMGIIVLCLALMGALFHKSKIKWYFIITALLALIFSFGKHFFLYQIFYDYFPYFNKFRVPAMFLILTQFSMAVLAGLGLEITIKRIKDNNGWLIEKKMAWACLGIFIVIIGLKFMIGNQPDFGVHSHPVLDSLRIELINSDVIRVLLFLIVGCAVFYITRLNWITHYGLAGIVITLSIIDIILVDQKIIEPDKGSFRQSTLSKKSLKSAYLSEDEVIHFLKQDTSLYRILPLGSLGNENRWAAFQIESIMGYHPAKIFRYNQVKDEVGWNSLGVLKMLNVKYVITFEELLHPAFNRVFYGNIFHQGRYQKANVYQYNNFIPRAFFVSSIQNISKNSHQLEILKKSDFNPLKLSFVEHNPEDFEYSTEAEVEISYWTPDKIEFQLNAPTKQFMVLSEIFYPQGWKVTSHPDWIIHPVNTILRGIYIPSGNHRMIMEFIPYDIFYGSILTWSSTIIIIFLILSGMFNRRRNNADQ